MKAISSSPKPATILTLHPDPNKSGKNISIEKYEPVKTQLLRILGKQEPTHGELMDAMDAALKNRFDGNIGWYSETVKLDLEARKLIERTATKPVRYRLVKPKK